MKKRILEQGIFGVSFFNEAQKGLFQFLEDKSASTYDKIMDAIYNETHIGGGLHRHFDGSHTLAGSYQKIKDSVGDVDFGDFIKAHLDELVTPNGIPLFDLNQGRFNQLTNEIADNLGGAVTSSQLRGYLCDLNSINAGELASASLGCIFLFAAFKSGDSKAIARTSAINLCIGFATANPIQVLTGLAGVSVGIYQGKIEAWDLLTGAAPVVAGLSATQVAAYLGATKTIGAGVGFIGAISTAILMQHLDRKKQDRLKNELGDNQRYISVMTPSLVQQQIEIVSRNSFNLGIPI